MYEDDSEDTTEINPECYGDGDGRAAGGAGDAPRAPRDYAVRGKRRGLFFKSVFGKLFDAD
jgi:hypothetical protein